LVGEEESTFVGVAKKGNVSEKVRLITDRLDERMVSLGRGSDSPKLI